MKLTIPLKASRDSLGLTMSFINVSDSFGFCNGDFTRAFPQVTNADKVVLKVSDKPMKKKGDIKVPVSGYYATINGTEYALSGRTGYWVTKTFPNVSTFYVNVVKVS